MISDYDKQHMTAPQLADLMSATNKYNQAAANNDYAGMQSASDEAAQYRKNAGYTTDDYGNYTKDYTPALSGWQASQAKKASGYGGSYYKNILGDDFGNYLNNKRIATFADPDSEAYKSAAAYNQSLRDKYGLGNDNMDYYSLATQYGSKYGNGVDNYLNSMGKTTKYNDKYANDVKNAYTALTGFNYSPDSDADYQNYLGTLDRQSQSAQKQSIANLSAMTGGRNNSWASAATAQVGQAYAQKGAYAQADFADRAYNRLLQRFNITNQMSNTAYDRNTQNLNNQMNLYNAYSQAQQNDINNNRQGLLDASDLRNNDLTYNMNNFQYGLNKAYLPQQYEDEARARKQGLILGDINIDYLPKEKEAALDSMNAGTEGQYLQNQYYPQLIQSQISATNRSNRGSGGSPAKPTQYQQQQAVKSQIAQLLYPSNLPSGVSSTYYPLQQLQNNRGTFASYAGEDYTNNLIRAEAAKIAKNESTVNDDGTVNPVSVNDVLEKYGFGDLAKY